MKYVGAVAVALLMAVPLGAQNTSRIIERVLVRVNGEIFTQTQLERRRTDAIRERNVEPTKVDIALINEVTPEILVVAVDELLLVQRGRELGVKFTDENFKVALDNIKKTNNLDDAKLKEALSQEGITIEQLRENIERTWMIRGWQQAEIHLNLTEEEARQYYQSHPDDFMKPATVTLRQIVVTMQTSAAAQKGASLFNAGNTGGEAQAKQRIDDARARLVKGEDFAAVAAEVSDAGSKANGGLIGQIVLDQLDPQLKELLDKLKPGEFSEPLRTQNGYQIFKVDSRTTPERETFAKVREQIGQRIFDERSEGETKKHLTRLRAQALIEWKDPTYKAMYDKKMLAEK